MSLRSSSIPFSLPMREFPTILNSSANDSAPKTPAVTPSLNNSPKERSPLAKKTSRSPSSKLGNGSRGLRSVLVKAAKPLSTASLSGLDKP